jgi:oligoendopeptidase F
MGKYAVTWDLDSLLAHPETAQFRELFEAYRKDLEQAAADSEKLEPLSKTSLKVWEEYVPRLSGLMSRSEDLHAFIGCHAAGDAENKLFQQIEGQLAGVSPLRSQIFTNLEFALQTSSDADYAACM